ncbi:MUC5B protein, partial [Leiothrix lutea]|nr:MUC5B protein [Leiothrix lutea]
MKRNGEVVKSFKEMALDWKVPYPTNRYCNPGASRPSKIEYHQHCVPSNLCKIIWSLTECHGVVPPQPYYEACVASGCSEEHPSTECQSMQTYAALCGLHGVCVDWRRLASGQCEASCPQDQVYKPCGDAKRNTCFSRGVVMDTLPSQNSTSVFVEGCYCPDGKILLNDHDGVCVSVCGCTAQDGSVKQPREAWEHDCQYCTCDEATLNISCLPRPCAKSPPINCTKEGFVRKIKPRLEDPCCTETVCECDIKTCIINKTACDLGFQPVVAMSEDGCCPIFSCIPKGVCVSEGVEFKPGAVVPKSSCENCVCTDEQDPVTQTNRIQCLPVQCQTTCQQGFRYVEEKGQCCSQCQQVACVANFPFGNVTIEVGKSYKDPYDNCTHYTCTESAGQFSLTSTIKVCLPFEEANCVPGTVEVSSDGCCKTCIDLPHKCKRNVKEQYIVHGKCKSAAPVPVPFCEGMCSTYSVYSFEASEMEHKCTCCHEKRSHKAKVELVCSDHKTVQFTYVYVDECGCVETKCPKRIT